jgi:ribosomal protein S18 acetylase RimI-like enzyme
MVTLLKMTQIELDEYLKHAIPSLAEELMRANGWSAERSLAASLQSFDTALPGRAVDSPKQFLRTILADEQKVGILWYGIRGQQEAFVWDLLIYPQLRNRGFGREALKAMEQELREMKVESVALNVFAHNSAAARLYSNLGYAPVSTRMSKRLE